MLEPAYMKWEDLRDMLFARLKDDENEDDDLVATRAEVCALLGWAHHFERLSLPRTEEEERIFAFIKRGAELLRSQTDSES